MPGRHIRRRQAEQSGVGIAARHAEKRRIWMGDTALGLGLFILLAPAVYYIIWRKGYR